MKNQNTPLWKELVNPHYEPDGGKPTSVPAESQRKIRKHLEGIALELVESAGQRSDDGEDSDGDTLLVFTRTRKEGHPAAWVGGGISEEGSFEGVILCTDFLQLRKPLYVGNSGSEPWRQALVWLGNRDVILHVEGDLLETEPEPVGNRGIYPSAIDLKSLQVEASRVTDREVACSSVTGGVADIESSKARRLFFSLLRKHPKIGEGLSSADSDGQCFVANGEESPNTEAYEGVVRKFVHEKGFGFIEADGITEDIFVHAGDSKTELQPGDHVRFDLTETTKGPRAINVELSERNRKEGIVDQFFKEKGYGFIRLPDNGSDNAFVHITDVRGETLSEGDPVKFAVEMGDRGPRAVYVEKTTGATSGATL